MDEVLRKKLELFVENVEELKKYCTPENNFGGLMGISRKSEEEEWHIEPAIKGFLLTFSWFAYFPGDLKELRSHRRVLVRLNSMFPSLRQGMLDFGSKHFGQVGNGYHFIGVFIPKVGNTIHFRPKKMSEPSVRLFLTATLVATLPKLLARKHYHSWLCCILIPLANSSTELKSSAIVSFCQAGTEG